MVANGCVKFNNLRVNVYHSSFIGQLFLPLIFNLKQLAGKFDVVVNCAGIGSKELARDDNVFPVRGVIVRVSTCTLVRKGAPFCTKGKVANKRGSDPDCSLPPSVPPPPLSVCLSVSLPSLLPPTSLCLSVSLPSLLPPTSLCLSVSLPLSLSPSLPASFSSCISLALTKASVTLGRHQLT